MTNDDLQAIRDFVAGPKPDVLCVVMAKTAIPEMLAEIERLQQQLESMREEQRAAGLTEIEHGWYDA